jgi:hypothetical protein
MQGIGPITDPNDIAPALNNGRRMTVLTPFFARHMATAKASFRDGTS